VELVSKVIADACAREAAADCADQRTFAAVPVVDDRAERGAADRADDCSRLSLVQIARLAQVVGRAGGKQQGGQQGKDDVWLVHGNSFPAG